MICRAATSGISIAVLLFVALTGIGATSPVAGPQSAAGQDPASCTALVRAAVANEVAANNSSTKHMFKSHKTTAQGSQTRIYVETREAMAGMTIAYNDQPLAPAQMQGEENRLAALVNDPQQLRHKYAQEQENTERTLRILKALPDAFVFEYDGEKKGAVNLGEERARLVWLKFRPNPDFQPPSHVEQVLLGMEGVVVIDPVEQRIAKIDGTLFKEVSFGWGILGHLDKGGHFLVEQCDAGNDSWEVSRMSLSFTGKILLFKNLAIKSDEVFSGFRRVPDDTTFAQGVEMLKAEEVKLAQNRDAEAVKTEDRSH